MRDYKQFITWRYEDKGGEKPTKTPYNPFTKEHAKVNDPTTWCSFEEAVQAADSGEFDGIGFVLTVNDPFGFIDLDKPSPNLSSLEQKTALSRQIKIYEEFNSYAERSPSGHGLHIIVKGSVPSGRKRQSIEIYSDLRYMTMTGDVFGCRNEIIEYNDQLNLLWSQMGKGGVATEVYGGDVEEHITDDEVIERALNAENGDKFDILLNGNWLDLYPSQSEADQAFINIIAFYTQNRIQIMRIFRNSPLGQREKAQRNDYLNYTINKSFDQMLPPLDFDGLKIQLEELMNKNKQQAIPEAPLPSPPTPQAPPPPDKQELTLPPGLVGEIAQFIYAASPRPVKEVSLIAALGLMAGICGRSYNISKTGLNQYLMLLAPSGTGKEAIASGIDKLMSQVKMTVPSAMGFVGPGRMASGQALNKSLSSADVPSFLSIVGEFGLTMQRLAHPRATQGDLALKDMILDLYNKSGNGQLLKSTIYSDRQNNTKTIASPALTLIGESTPETLYGALDENLVSDGLLPRFTILEYVGKRPRLSDTFHTAEPTFDLVQRIAKLCDASLQLNTHNAAIDVKMTDDAKSFFRWINEYCDDEYDKVNQDALKSLWSRGYVKVLKLAALIAVGVNHEMPTIKLEHAKWAFNLIDNDIKALIERFNDGTIGSGTEEGQQIEAMVNAFKVYISVPFEAVEKYKVDQRLHHDKVIPYTYLQRKLVSMACYRHDRLTSTLAIKRAIDTLLERGDIVEAPKTQISQKYGLNGRCFMIASNIAFI